MKTLNHVTTKWKKINDVIRNQGPKALAGYLTRHYFSPLAEMFRRHRPSLSHLESEELASDLLFELIKNNYRGIHRLDQNRGKLRGLFQKMIRARLSRLDDDRYRLIEDDDAPIDGLEAILDIHQDIHQALEQLAEDKPHLY